VLTCHYQRRYSIRINHVSQTIGLDVFQREQQFHVQLPEQSQIDSTTGSSGCFFSGAKFSKLLLQLLLVTRQNVRENLALAKIVRFHQEYEVDQHGRQVYCRLANFNVQQAHVRFQLIHVEQFSIQRDQVQVCLVNFSTKNVQLF